jgi:hypothetical protein
MLLLHHLVSFLTAFDFGDQSPLGLCEATNEAFIPLRLIRVAALWSLSCSYTEENADFPPGPLVHNSLVEGFWGGVKTTVAIVVEHGLADLDWFEC